VRYLLVIPLVVFAAWVFNRERSMWVENAYRSGTNWPRVALTGLALVASAILAAVIGG
jgi:hypothetical protein